MKPEDCKVGMAVEYAPSPNRWFKGTVNDQPRQYSTSGTWVTVLIDMEPGYAEYTGKSGDKATTVYAAALASIRPA
jgi:hypothetical protein